MICERCKEDKATSKFLQFKDKQIKPICKDCLYSNIKDENIETLLPLMQEFDIPYIEDVWRRLLNNKSIAAPSIFGKYLATMKLYSYSSFGYNDSYLFNNKESDL